MKMIMIIIYMLFIYLFLKMFKNEQSVIIVYAVFIYDWNNFENVSYMIQHYHILTLVQFETPNNIILSYVFWIGKSI